MDKSLVINININIKSLVININIINIINIAFYQINNQPLDISTIKTYWVIEWIVIYSLDTALHPLNKWGLWYFCALTSDVLTIGFLLYISLCLFKNLIEWPKSTGEFV